jgi:large subunit ribosomal protein L11
MAPKKKEITKIIKLQIEAGKANPSPPVGPALGQAGANIMEFCKQFNDRTKAMQGPIPVLIEVYKDKTFSFITKLPPVPYLILQKIGLKSGSKTPGVASAGKINMKQIKEIAEFKMPDLNANDIDAAARMVRGSAVSMGLEIVE